MRIGIGYDCHKLVHGRRLILGGVEIPYEKGLFGHSDGDVLIHAICDAILGAISQKDIGFHFPDDDVSYFGISSKIILSRCLDMLKERGYRILNIDSVVVAQKPKISPFREKIVESLSKIIGLEEEKISVKAKTTEGLGFVGKEEGIEAYAVVLIEKEET